MRTFCTADSKFPPLRDDRTRSANIQVWIAELSSESFMVHLYHDPRIATRFALHDLGLTTPRVDPRYEHKCQEAENAAGWK